MTEASYGSEDEWHHDMLKLYASSLVDDILPCGLIDVQCLPLNFFPLEGEVDFAAVKTALHYPGKAWEFLVSPLGPTSRTVYSGPAPSSLISSGSAGAPGEDMDLLVFVGPSTSFCWPICLKRM